MNLRKLFDKIDEYVHESDPNVGDVLYGDIYQLNHLQTISYPAVVVTCGQHRSLIDDGFFIYRLNIFYVERLMDNENNKIDIHAVGINFMNALIRHLADELIVNDYTINCFNQRFNDWCAGVYANIMIQIPISECYEIYDSMK